MSRLSMNTTQPGRARQAVWTLDVSSSIADSVDRFFLTPIWFHGSSSAVSAAVDIRSATIFFISFVMVFSSVMGL